MSDTIEFFYIVGLALIGGILTWLMRRGGCTSRTNRRNKDGFEHQPDDYTLDMSEPNTSPAVAAAGLTSPLHNHQNARPFVPAYAQQDMHYDYNDPNGVGAGGYYYDERQEQDLGSQKYYNQQPYYQQSSPMMAAAAGNTAQDFKPDEVVEHKPNVA